MKDATRKPQAAAGNFEFSEDKEYFVRLLAQGRTDEFDHWMKLFDFRSPAIKRREFSRIRRKVFGRLVRVCQAECQLKLPVCTGNRGLVVDHFIPLSSNILNKRLRGLKPRKGRKVPTQSFGSNHPSNLMLSCGMCNSFKKHRFIDPVPLELRKEIMRRLRIKQESALRPALQESADPSLRSG